MSISLGLAENYAMLGNTYLVMQTAGDVKGFMGSNFLSYPAVPNVDSNGIQLNAGPIPNAPIVNGAAAKQAIDDVKAAVLLYQAVTPAYPPIVGSINLNATYTNPGLYTITGNLTTNVDVTLSGTATDIYVFNVTGTINIQKNITLSGILPQNVIFIAGVFMFLGGGLLSTKYGIYISTGDFANIQDTNLIGRLISTNSRASIFSSATITAPQFA